MSTDPASNGQESFYALRRTDGGLLADDYAWWVVRGPDDWAAAADDAIDSGEPATEYEIVRFVVEPLARRTFPDPSWKGDDD